MADLDMRFTPRIMIGSAVRLGTDAASRGERALIIADSALDKDAVSLQEQLDSFGVSAILFARDGLGSDSESLDEALSLARGSRARMVVSVGGDKVLSLGRLVSALAPSRLYAANVLESPVVENKGLPLLEVPSSGRHSLLFRHEAFLGDRKGNRSALASFQPPADHTVILDSTLIAKTPRRITELSAALRLGAAVESFLSPRSTFLSEVQARAAVETALVLVRRVREEADHPDFRSAEMDSQLISAFSSGFTGIGPGLSLAWAAAWAGGFPRAAGYAILLPWVLESPLYAGSARAGSLSRLLADEPGAGSGDPAEDVRGLFGRLGLPGRLRELGADLGKLIPAAGWAARMAGGGRADFDETAFRDILEIAS